MSMPHPVVLTGERVTLEPFETEHAGALLAIARSAPAEFALTSTPVTEEQASEYFSTALKHRSSGFAYPFTVRLRSTGTIVGMTRFNDIDFQHRNTQLGYTWFSPDQYGSATNVECKLLQLTFAFETLKLYRVSIRTDVNNERSRRAVLALGAKEEGILRAHLRHRDGSLRDTVCFSILATEWPAVKAGLEAKLAAHAHG